MHLVASVCPFVCALTAEPFAAKSNKSHYQFKVFVCVSNQSAYADNRANAVDWRFNLF